MKEENTSNKVLEYLKKKGKANTFKIARELKIDRPKVLRIIKELVEKHKAEFVLGTVQLLNFPSKEVKKQIKAKKRAKKHKA